MSQDKEQASGWHCYKSITQTQMLRKLNNPFAFAQLLMEAKLNSETQLKKGSDLNLGLKLQPHSKPNKFFTYALSYSRKGLEYFGKYLKDASSMIINPIGKLTVVGDGGCEEEDGSESQKEAD